MSINYQKILEKCEMSFRSFKNKNWTFRGSFGNLSTFFAFYFFLYLETRNWLQVAQNESVVGGLVIR